MSEGQGTVSAPKARDVVVNRFTQGITNDTTAPAGNEGGTVVIWHEESGGITIVPRSAYEGSYRYNGWTEVDVEADREELFEAAQQMGVNVDETADGRTIVESIRAYRRKNREV